MTPTGAGIECVARRTLPAFPGLFVLSLNKRTAGPPAMGLDQMTWHPLTNLLCGGHMPLRDPRSASVSRIAVPVPVMYSPLTVSRTPLTPRVARDRSAPACFRQRWKSAGHHRGGHAGPGLGQAARRLLLGHQGESTWSTCSVPVGSRLREVARSPEMVHECG